MSFYTPTWIRRLVKEDHKNIEKYLDNQRNDFRDYIDANTPFVLWLDIQLIRERILKKSDSYIKELALAVSQTRDVSDIILDLLDKAYIATINAYANNPRYVKINGDELQEKLSLLSNADLGNIKSTIKKNFSQTLVVTNVTKKDKSVMLILPKFTTLEFGNVFKAELKKIVEKSADLEDDKPVAPVGGMFAGLTKSSSSTSDSEKSRMLAFVGSNFAKLQNIGHIEVDVVSEVDRKVMRGQNSPRLIQALVTLPNDVAEFKRLQLKFSKETGQATTRLKIRKRFSGSKLIFEMLVEHGLAVGVPETQADNLYKAKLERAFSIGSGLTASIRKDIGILAELETSKSMKQYLGESIKNAILGKTTPAYSSLAEIVEKTRVTKTKVQVVNTSKNPKTGTRPKTTGKKLNTIVSTSLVSLQSLINSSLVEQIKRNMGNGNRRDILNLRSGRFAESVKVERLSQSREGMITAFYTYMKNPYATFSQGGDQEFPRTRDPKLLISKSIREIATQQVANRLRAVSI